MRRRLYATDRCSWVEVVGRILATASRATSTRRRSRRCSTDSASFQDASRLGRRVHEIHDQAALRYCNTTTTHTAVRLLVKSGGYSIIESRFGYAVSPNPDSVKKCILLMNLNPDFVNPA